MDYREQQENGGWPLGLQLLRDRQIGSESEQDAPNYLMPDSTSVSSDSSSDLETESTVSSFCERSMTLGSLIGIGVNTTRDFADFQGQPAKGNPNEDFPARSSWWGLCAGFHQQSNEDIKDENDDMVTPSLAHYLEAERAAASARRSGGILYINVEMPPLEHGDGGLFAEDGENMPPATAHSCHESGENRVDSGYSEHRAYGTRNGTSQRFSLANSSVSKRLSRCFSPFGFVR